MQNPNDVTTLAFEGYATEIAMELGISNKRVFEMLNRDNPYPKVWRLLNPLGRLAPDRLELMRADFNARCERLTRGRSAPGSIATLNRETDEAVQAVMDRKPRAERRRELLEAIAEMQKELDAIDEIENAGLRVVDRFAS